MVAPSLRDAHGSKVCVVVPRRLGVATVDSSSGAVPWSPQPVLANRAVMMGSPNLMQIRDAVALAKT